MYLPAPLGTTLGLSLGVAIRILCGWHVACSVHADVEIIHPRAMVGSVEHGRPAHAAGRPFAPRLRVT